MTPAASDPGTGSASFQVTVSVDNNHCHFYAVCVQEAPEVFDLSIDGRLRYKAKPAAHLHEKVWNAARLCPMQAIHIDPAETVAIPPLREGAEDLPDSDGQRLRKLRTNGKTS